MNEKILWFKEKDAKRVNYLKNKKVFCLAKDNESNEGYAIEEDKLLHGVSLKGLEKWCKENSHTTWAKSEDHKPVKTKVKLIATHELLSFAKKKSREAQAKKE